MITKIKLSIERYVRNRIEEEERQMQKFVKQLNDTFPETLSQKSLLDSLDQPGSLDLSLRESEYLLLRKKLVSFYYRIRVLLMRFRQEKSFGQPRTTSPQELNKNSQSTTKQSEKDSAT
jgi:hypothetical protein